MKPGEMLQEGAKVLGYPISQQVGDQFDMYLAELLRWNKAYNLTAITDPREIVVKHFLDSLLFLKAMPPLTGLRVYDLGSGGGFPGIPLKLVRPDLHMNLVEPSRKKSSFLRHMIRSLALPETRVCQERWEGLGELAGADVIVSRALVKTREIQLGLKNVLPKGVRVVLSKGPTVEEEMRDLEFSIDLQRYSLPFHNVDRWLIIWIT